MKLAINQATLMKTPMDSFLDAISTAGFEGVELRRDEIFLYLQNHTIEKLNQLLIKKKSYMYYFQCGRIIFSMFRKRV